MQTVRIKSSLKNLMEFLKMVLFSVQTLVPQNLILLERGICDYTYIKMEKKSVKKVNKPKRKPSVKQSKVISETLIAILTHSTLTEASEHLKISRTTLWNRIEKYELRPIIDSIPEQAIDQLKLSSVKASEVLAKALDSYNENTKIDVAKDILNRVTKKESASAVAVQINNLVRSVEEDRDKYQ